MVNDSITLFTSIKPAVKRLVLLRGTLIALIGVALLTYSGIFIKADILSNYGLPIFLTGSFFIALGLIPYSRLTRIEIAPNKVMVTSDRLLHYYRHGKPLWTTPLSNIEYICRVNEKGVYGIGLKLKDNTNIPKLSIVGQIYARGIKTRYSVDTFFPYFSKRSYKELEEVIH